MKTLVYTTAFGEEHFFLLAERMVISLRRRGYRGDVVVLADRAFGFDPALGIEVVETGGPRSRPLLKARLHEFRDAASYDRILFVDTDVVFLRDPAPLLGLPGDLPRVSLEPSPLARSGFNLTFFSREERRLPAVAEGRAVNTGVMLFPGGAYADVAARWIAAWDAPEVRRKTAALPHGHAELRDQPVLQRLITRDGLEIGHLPDDLLRMPLLPADRRPLPPGAVLLHFNGSSRTARRKRELLNLMAAFTALDSHEDFARLCGRLQSSRGRPPAAEAAFA